MEVEIGRVKNFIEPPRKTWGQFKKQKYSRYTRRIERLKIIAKKLYQVDEKSRWKMLDDLAKRSTHNFDIMEYLEFQDAVEYVRKYFSPGLDWGRMAGLFMGLRRPDKGLIYSKICANYPTFHTLYTQQVLGIMGDILLFADEEYLKKLAEFLEYIREEGDFSKLHLAFKDTMTTYLEGQG